MSDVSYQRKKLFADYYDKWIATYKEGLVSTVTFDKYLLTAKSIRKLLPDTTMEQLNRSRFQTMMTEYGKDHERQTAMDFIHQIHASIIDAMDEGILKKNPMLRITITGKPHVKKHNMFLEKDQLNAVIDQMDLSQGGPVADKMLFLIAKTGLRFAEALALTPEDIDLDHLTLMVNKSWNYRFESDPEFKPTKTPSSVRTITIDYKLGRMLEKFMDGKDPKKAMFVPEGKRVYNSTYNKHLKKLCETAGVPVIGVHGLRHTHASILIAADVPILVVSKRLGHADVSITQKTYVHLLQPTETESDEKIAALMSSLG